MTRYLYKNTKDNITQRKKKDTKDNNICKSQRFSFK